MLAASDDELIESALEQMARLERLAGVVAAAAVRSRHREALFSPSHDQDRPDSEGSSQG